MRVIRALGVWREDGVTMRHFRWSLKWKKTVIWRVICFLDLKIRGYIPSWMVMKF